MANLKFNRRGAAAAKALVIYETIPAREQVAQMCSQNWLAEPADKISQWRSSSRLNEPAFADEAAQHAIGADMIIFTGPMENDFPAELKLWIERWLPKRTEREGAIVGIFIRGSSGNVARSGSQKEIYLRQIALRAGMDYLSHVPRLGRKAMPESLDVFSQRAGQMTSVLNDILQTSRPASFPHLIKR